MLLTRQICTNENSFNKKKNPCHEKTIRNGGSGSTALRNELLTMLTLLEHKVTLPCSLLADILKGRL